MWATYYRAVTSFADAVGTRIAFDIFGEGPDLVLLHAGIADRTMWQPQIEHLSGSYRVVTPDARGFGDTPIGAEPFSRRDDLEAVLDAADAARPSIVGCSIGAGFALDFAIEHPDRVNKLVLVGVTPSGFDKEPDAMLVELWPRVDEAIEAGDLRRAGEIEARIWVDGPRRPEGAAPSWLRERVIEWSLPINGVADWGVSRQIDPLAMERLGDVTAPTLVIVGAEDAELIRQGCLAAAAGIPGAELFEIPGTAHLPNLETPDAFNAALGGFLEL